uniref:Uncharacterized protein n=1 Tax=Rhizophora mucronata TaxID=61149 RepID=A0A2P2N3F2_RHIMU
MKSDIMHLILCTYHTNVLSTHSKSNCAVKIITQNTFFLFYMQIKKKK